MKDPNKKIVMFQWVVIGVLLVGGTIGGYMLFQKTEQFKADSETQQGNIDSLRNQLQQAKSSATPVPDESALPESSSNSSTASTSPTPTVKATVTPKP